MRTLAFVTALLLPLAAQAEKKEDITPDQQALVLRNCCAVPEEKEGQSLLGNLKRDGGLKKVIRERRILLFAIDSGRPEDGRIDLGKHGKTFGIMYKRETGIFEGP